MSNKHYRDLPKKEKKEIGPHWDVFNPRNWKHHNIYTKENLSLETQYKVKIRCSKVLFSSCLDEGLFWAWIRQIPSIQDIDGCGEELRLYFKSKVIINDDLRELLAIFCRYKIDMKPLGIFLSNQNRDWFYEDKRTFWHKKIFSSDS